MAHAVLAALDRIFSSGGILAFHGVVPEPFLPSVHITPAALARHLEFVAAQFDVLPLSELVARREHGRTADRCVAITYDDAYSGLLQHALPVAERLGLPFTVFVATDFVHAGRRFWWDRVEWLRLHGSLAQDAQHVLPARLPDLHVWMIRHHRGLVPPQLDSLLSDREAQAGLVPHRALTEGELLQLARSELVTFASHTASHPALPGLADEEIRTELTTSLRWLEERLPRVERFVAYPYGMSDHRVARIAREAGMRAGFTIAGHAIGSRFPLHRCSRIGLAESHSERTLRVRLSRAMIPMLRARPHLARSVNRSGSQPI